MSTTYHPLPSIPVQVTEQHTSRSFTLKHQISYHFFQLKPVPSPLNFKVSYPYSTIKKWVGPNGTDAFYNAYETLQFPGRELKNLAGGAIDFWRGTTNECVGGERYWPVNFFWLISSCWIFLRLERLTISFVRFIDCFAGFKDNNQLNFSQRGELTNIIHSTPLLRRITLDHHIWTLCSPAYIQPLVPFWPYLALLGCSNRNHAACYSTLDTGFSSAQPYSNSRLKSCFAK